MESVEDEFKKDEDEEASPWKIFCVGAYGSCATVSQETLTEVLAATVDKVKTGNRKGVETILEIMVLWPRTKSEALAVKGPVPPKWVCTVISQKRPRRTQDTSDPNRLGFKT